MVLQGDVKATNMHIKALVVEGIAAKKQKKVKVVLKSLQLWTAVLALLEFINVVAQSAEMSSQGSHKKNV